MGEKLDRFLFKALDVMQDVTGGRFEGWMDAFVEGLRGAGFGRGREWTEEDVLEDARLRREASPPVTGVSPEELGVDPALLGEAVEAAQGLEGSKTPGLDKGRLAPEQKAAVREDLFGPPNNTPSVQAAEADSIQR